MSLVYTNIQHSFRKEHGLTCNEYVLADMVFKLCAWPGSKNPGWCYMSRPEMAEEMGVSKQTILNLIESLIEKKLLIKNPKNSYLKTEVIWGSTFFTAGGKESLPLGGKESLPNNNNIDNNINNTNEELKNSSSKAYPLIIEFWLKEFHINWTFSAQHGKEVKAIIGKIKKLIARPDKIVTTEEIVDTFKIICLRLPEWYKEKDLAVINSKFNEIITEIKNGSGKKSITKDVGQQYRKTDR